MAVAARFYVTGSRDRSGRFIDPYKGREEMLIRVDNGPFRANADTVKPKMVESFGLNLAGLIVPPFLFRSQLTGFTNNMSQNTTV
jgi:hypothetical protein